MQLEISHISLPTLRLQDSLLDKPGQVVAVLQLQGAPQ